MNDHPYIHAVGDNAFAERAIERAADEIRRVIAGQRHCSSARSSPSSRVALTIKTVADVLGGTFQRVQFTPGRWRASANAAVAALRQQVVPLVARQLAVRDAARLRGPRGRIDIPHDSQA